MVKLTQEQQKLVEDNHALLFYVMYNKNLLAQHEYGECYGALAEGLCKAAATYDPERGTKFATYATHCMLVEVFGLKRQRERFGRARFTMASLEAPLSSDGTSELGDLLEDVPNSEFATNYETAEAIRKAFKQFADESARNVYTRNDYETLLLCVHGLSQCEVAKALGISQPQVCRRVSNARKRLLRTLNEQGITL